MTSQKVGTSTSKAEVLNVSIHGIWLYVAGKEYFLAYEDYPWFKDAIVGDIFDVEVPNPSHLYWPKLDVDLEVDSLENPDQYPLVYK